MTLIENGVVVDGMGAVPYQADVVIDGDRIADVVRRDGGAEGGQRGRFAPENVLDASGCLVTPGFIDAHSHSDAYLLLEPSAPSKLSQGITTEVNGQCGGSAAPRYGDARLSSDWASMIYPRLSSGGVAVASAAGPTWRSLADYRALLDAVRPAINTVQFVGHNTLRSSVIGYDPVRATPETLRRMGDLLARELDDGASGFSTGLVYQPGKYSDPHEVAALAKIAAARGALYSTHMRSEGDAILEAIDEVLELVRLTGIRAEISHLKTSARRNWGKIGAVLEKVEGAVERGELLGSDRYPYCAAGTDLDVVLPDWAGEGGIAAENARLADRAVCDRVAAELDASDRDWSGVMFGGAWTDRTRAMCGRTVADVARECAVTPGRLVVEVLRLDACRTGAFFFGMSEDNLQLICERPWIVPGSDASLRSPVGQLGADHPHPRAYGTMPRFFRLLTGRLEGHARICSTAEAVARMTSVPAARFGLKGRGVIAPGMFADVAVWREDSFREKGTYVEPHSFCEGMEAVFVNGVLSYRPRMFTPRGAGRLLQAGRS